MEYKGLNDRIIMVKLQAIPNRINRDPRDEKYRPIVPRSGRTKISTHN